MTLHLISRSNSARVHCHNTQTVLFAINTKRLTAIRVEMRACCNRSCHLAQHEWLIHSILPSLLQETDKKTNSQAKLWTPLFSERIRWVCVLFPLQMLYIYHSATEHCSLPSNYVFQRLNYHHSARSHKCATSFQLLKKCFNYFGVFFLLLCFGHAFLV